MAQLGVGWVRELRGVGKPGSHHVIWRASAACIALQDVSTTFLWGREEGLGPWWVGPVISGGVSVGIVWKLVQLEMPAEESGKGGKSL